MLATALAASLPLVLPAPHDPPGQQPSRTLSFSSSSDLFVVTSSDIASSDHFGRSLDVDGSTALVGSRYAAHSGVVLSGAAYVLEQHGLNWIETHKLIPPNPADQDLFGHDVAVSGETLLISARNDDLGAIVDAGSAYVFVKDGADWTLQAQLMAPDADAFDAFGISVDIEGDTAVVGAALDDEFGQEDVGSAYVFVREGGVWTFEAKLMASDGAGGDTFGRGVAVSGETIAVGAPRHDSLGLERAGAVYVFDRLDGAWSESAKLVAPDAMPGDDFGDALVLEGHTLLAGASLDDHQGQLDVGSVGVFVRADGTWMPQAKLLASDGIAGDQFGHYMALDGDRAAVGASQARVGLVEEAGSAYQFERNGDQWTEILKTTATVPGPNENYGSTVGFADNALLVGAPHQNPDGLFQAGVMHVHPFETDCNGDGIDDGDELILEASLDCNQNWILDACELASGAALDLDGDGALDTCQPFAIDGPSISIAAGGTLGLSLDAGPDQAGHFFVVLGSLSGTSPGLVINEQLLPLNLDAYLLLTLSGGGPIETGLGLLDAQGQGSTALSIPAGLLNPTAAGQTVHHAFASVHPVLAVVTFASNALPTELVP